jgi:hypothetical protein
MSDTTVQIINCETGEETIREMTADELKQYEIDRLDSERAKAKALSEAADKAALLTKLGISADEAKLLLS